MDWPKIISYVGLTSVVVSIIAQIAARIIPEPYHAAQIQDVIRWAGYLWAYASIAMACLLLKLTRRLSEIFWGGASALLCLLFPFGMLFSLIYFFWAYTKLDKMGKGLPY